MKTTRNYLAAIPFDEGIAAERLSGGRVAISARRDRLDAQRPYIAEVMGVDDVFNYQRRFPKSQMVVGHSAIHDTITTATVYLDYPMLLDIRARFRGFYCLYRKIGGNAKLAPIDELTMRSLLAAKLGHPLEDDEPELAEPAKMITKPPGLPAWRKAYLDEYAKLLDEPSKPLMSMPAPVVAPKPKKRKTAQPKEGLFKPRLRVAEIGRKRIVDFDDD